MKVRDEWKILLIEDDEDDYILTRAMICDIESLGCSLCWEDDFDAGLALLGQQDWDAVLVDYDLGGRNGIEFIEQAERRGIRTPMILLTGRGSYELDLAAMHAGASDYLSKREISGALLERAIRYAIERKHHEEALRQAQHELEARVQERTLDLSIAYEQLSHSTQLLERMFSNIHLHVAYLDRGFNFIRVNRRYAEYHEREPDFFTGKNHFDLFPNAANQAIFQHVVESGEPFEALARPFEAFFNPERGVTYWDWSLQPVKEADGEVSGLVLSLVDVTPRILAQQQLAYHAYLLQNINDAVIATDERLHLTAWNHAAERIYGWTAEEVLGRDSREVIKPQYLEGSSDSVSLQLERDGRYFGEQLNTRKDGQVIHVDGRLMALREEHGRLTGFVSVNRDITEQKASEAQERKQEARRIALAELSQSLAEAGLDERQILETIIRRSVELVGDAGGATLLSEVIQGGQGKTNEPVIQSIAFAHRDPNIDRWIQELSRPGVTLLGEGTISHVISTGKSLRLNPRSPQEINTRILRQHWPYMDKTPIYSLLVVPMRNQGQAIGTLGLSRLSPDHPYTKEDQSLLEEMAYRAALALANSRLFHALEAELVERKRMEAELAEVHRRLMDSREDERRQIAQDIHDGPMQALYGVIFQLRSNRSGVEPSISEMALNAATQIQEVNSTLRQICGELRPPALAPYGLEKAIRSYADTFQQRRPDISISLELNEDNQLLPERVRLALYRIFQQALENVARHSQADRVAVRFLMDAESILLEVSDNGKGFLPEGRWVDYVREGHLGLAGSAERAEAIGGKFEVVSRPGQGATVCVTLPREEALPEGIEG